MWLPIGGAISDKVGRRPLLIFTVAAICDGLSGDALAGERAIDTRLLIVELWFSMFFGMYNGAMVPYLTEIMPQEIRTSGFSLAFSLATAIFGGFTPAICTYLIHVTGNRAMPALWLSSRRCAGSSRRSPGMAAATAALQSNRDPRIEIVFNSS